VFEKHGVDALVFPYVPTFAQPIRNPVYTIDDPAFVKSEAPVPGNDVGLQFGRLSLHRRSNGLRIPGLADDHHVLWQTLR